MEKQQIFHREKREGIVEINMKERPALDRKLDSKTFRDYYYLKEELVSFCRENGLPVSGGKIELTERIAVFLETGEVMP